MRFSALLATALLAVPHSAHGQYLGSSTAAITAYFAEKSLLPVAVPNGEEPGDAYISPAYGFHFRRPDCLAGLQPSQVGTVLPQAEYLTNVNTDLGMAVEIRRVVEVATRQNVAFTGTVRIEFGDPVIASASHVDLAAEIGAAPAHCRRMLDSVLELEGGRAQETVPWILRDVVYARPAYILETGTAIDAAVQAGLEAEISRLLNSPSFAMSMTYAHGRRLVVEADGPVPVAYRPAFLSLDDMRRLQSHDEDGVWSWLRSLFAGDTAVREEIESARHKFRLLSGTLPEVASVHAAMMSGESVPFDPGNEEHLQYLERAGLLLAVASEFEAETPK